MVEKRAIRKQNTKPEMEKRHFLVKYNYIITVTLRALISFFVCLFLIYSIAETGSI